MPTTASTTASSPERLTVQRRGHSAPVSAASAQSPAEISTIRFRVSSDDVDELGDVVVQAGLTWPEVVPAVVDHAREMGASVGAWRDVERADHETFATLHLLPYGVSRMADLVRHLHVSGLPLGSSVSFDILRSDIGPRLDAKGRQVGNVYRRGIVREVTLTQFPANPAAVAVARSLGFSSDDLAALSRVTASTPASVHRGPLPVGAASATPRGHIMTLAEQIAAAQAAHDAAQATLAAAIEANDNTDASVSAIQRATTECDALANRLTVLRAAQAAAAVRATGVAGDATAQAAANANAPGQQSAVSRTNVLAVPGSAGDAAAQAIARAHHHSINTRRTNTQDLPAGTLLARMCIARTVAHESKDNLAAVAERLFPGDQPVIAIARTAVAAADTTTAGWAAELVRQESRAMLQTDEFVEVSLWATLARLSGITLDFAGARRVTIPSALVDTSDGGTAWVGENGVIPVAKGTVSGKSIDRYKLAGIIPITKELERSSNPSAVAVMRQMLVRFIGNLLDKSILDALAEVTGIRPAGLLNGVTLTAGTAGGGIAAVQADLKTLIGKFIASNVGARPVLIVNPATKLSLGLMTTALGEFIFRDEVNGGQLLNIPLVASRHMPAGQVVLVDAANFASAFDAMEIDMSEQATLTMANADGTAPTQAMSTAGALGTASQVPPDRGISVSGGTTGAATAGYQAMSLFQTWTLAIRVVMPAGFAMTRPGSVEGLTGVTW